jgi:CO dehydrogenase maturation factor
MKIAFAGKGGSGKSTMAALFIRHLQRQGRNVLAIDADLNMNLAGLLGVAFPRAKVLSAPVVAATLRTHLKGANTRIPDIAKFLPTTLPGAGSNLIRRYDDPALEPCSVDAGDGTRLLTVGTYESGDIGQSCYHGHLFAAENLLSHTVTGDAFDVVCDMTAGTDAFSYSFHLQFDAIVLIAEPTPESAEVCDLYRTLAVEAGMDGLVHLLANKVADEDDLAFIRRRAGGRENWAVPVLPSLKKARQRGEPASAALLEPSLAAVMAEIETAARNPAIPERQRVPMLHRLHERLNGKDWVRQTYGDVGGQIDPDFNREEAA